MANIELDGTNKKIKVDSGDLTLDIPGDIILDADGANVTFKDGGTSVLDLSNSSTDAVLTVSTQDKDLIIKGDDGGAAVTAATFDMSDAGTLVLNHDIRIGDAGQIGSASDADAIAIASNGVVTFSQAPVFPDGSIAVADLDIDGATDIGAAIVDADLFVIDDGAGGTNRKTAASRLKTYIGGGIASASQWRLTANFTGDASPVASNWEEVDTDGYGSIGSDMTQSSGIFTFPSTGVWWVTFDFMCFSDSQGATAYVDGELNTTTDNSTYAIAAQTRLNLAGNSYSMAAHASFIFDVTNTTTHKVRFDISTNAGTAVGATDVNRTYATFIRLGDT
jgi:hypothetical protein